MADATTTLRRWAAPLALLVGVTAGCSASTPAGGGGHGSSAGDVNAVATPSASTASSGATSGPNLPGAPRASRTAQALPGTPAAIAVSGAQLWAVTSSTTPGQPGALLAATVDHPVFHRVASVGTQPLALAATSTRVWVVNATTDPRDRGSLPGIVEEFDQAGRALHTYPVPGAVSVTAAGTRAWVETVQPGRSGTVAVLAAGVVRTLLSSRDLAEPAPGAAGVTLSSPTVLTVLTTSAAGYLGVRRVNADTGGPAGGPAQTSLIGTGSAASSGREQVVGAGNVGTGGIALVRGAVTTTVTAGCRRDIAAVAANPAGTGGVWSVSFPDSTQQVAVQRITTTDCSIPAMVPSPGAGAVLAAADGAWVLTPAALFHLT